VKLQLETKGRKTGWWAQAARDRVFLAAFFSAFFGIFFFCFFVFFLPTVGKLSFWMGWKAKLLPELQDLCRAG
jgi:hypothetical protein